MPRDGSLTSAMSCGRLDVILRLAKGERELTNSVREPGKFTVTFQSVGKSLTLPRVVEVI